MYLCGLEWPLRLFEVLTRNCQSALGWICRKWGAQVQQLRMFTIPPRQRLPATRRLAIRRWSSACPRRIPILFFILLFLLVIQTHTHTHSGWRCENTKQLVFEIHIHIRTQRDTSHMLMQKANIFFFFLSSHQNSLLKKYGCVRAIESYPKTTQNTKKCPPIRSRFVPSPAKCEGEVTETETTKMRCL